jgi:hypothetical protein
MRSVLVRCVLLLASVLVVGCASEKLVAAPTQVMLRIYNNDTALTERMTTLEVAFSLLEGSTYREYPVKRFPRSALVWPVDVPIIPGTHADEFKQFEVVVRALADEDVLAEVRAITSFVPDQRKVLEVWLFLCPGHDDAPFVCESPGCHGEQCQTCLADGSCGPVGVTDPGGLPVFEIDQTPQTKPMPTDIVTDSVEAMDGGALGDASMMADGALVDASECSLECGAHAHCALQAGMPKCDCLSGFSPGAGGACTDIDECMLPERGGCSINADCKNNEGGRSCSCKEGFQDTKGDGSECTSRCSLAGCDANATCSIVGSEAKCQCTGAYAGDGKTCTYNPSCAALNCGASTTCGLKSGSTTDYECKCQSGYEPDTSMPAFACKDVDECTATPSVCAATAQSTCANSTGGFTCPCKAGFRKNGAGTTCEDIPDCPANACAGGACVEGVNDYSCNCTAGYTPAANGKSCMDARNDCPAGACTPGGACVDGVNAYTCTCSAGYTLSTDKHSCTDNNDCSPNPCKNGGVCSDRVNDFACDCTGTGFIGKDCGTRSTGCSMVGTSCTVGRGECLRSGTYVCDAQGTTLVCNVSAGASVAELCDGKDNDCDGSTDEDFTTLRMTCTAGAGPCLASGTNVCTANGSGVVCNAVAGTPAANDAICNNRDDDCNGQTDEDYVKHSTSCGVGACANTGTSSCVSGVEQPNCTPRAAGTEICDGLDNNCDGTPDNAALLPDTCLDNDRLQRCVSGASRTDRCSQRTPTAGTCVVNACMGACFAGSKQCDATGNLQTCGTGGDWGVGVACNANFLCDRTARNCVANAPFTWGNASPTGGTDSGVSDGEILATPIKASEDVLLKSIGMHGSSTNSGGRTRYALYGDAMVNGRHQPGALLTYTDIVDPFFANQTNTLPTNDDYPLKAGTLYWLAAKTSEVSGENVRVLSYDKTAAADGTGTRVRVFSPWAGLPPTTFPVATQDDGLEWGIFAIVQRYWH